MNGLDVICRIRQLDPEAAIRAAAGPHQKWRVHRHCEVVVPVVTDEIPGPTLRSIARQASHCLGSGWLPTDRPIRRRRIRLTPSQDPTGSPARSRYTARYTRRLEAWITQFDEVELSSFGRTIAAARRHTHQALAASLGTTVARLPRITDVVTGSEALFAAQVVAEREDAAHLAVRASVRTRQVVRRLRTAGWSLADVADVLHISRQAVSKLERQSVAGT